MAAANGINNSLMGPTHTIAWTWMLDADTLPYGGSFWPRGSFGRGWLQVSALWKGDITAPGMLVHEMGHGIFEFDDHDWTSGNTNNDDIMSAGGYNCDAWIVPYYSAPDCHFHDWWPVFRADDVGDLGLFVLHPFESVDWDSLRFFLPRNPERI